MNKITSSGVSVIIAVYNREKYIKETIDSIISQEYNKDLEIIIADDGSTDNSIRLIQSYKDSRIKIIEKPKDCKTQGAASTRNRGLLKATKDFICFLDSDDYQLPGFLANMTSVLENNKNASFVFCRTIEQIEKGGNIKQIPWTKRRIISLDIKYLGLTGSNVVNTDCFIFKKEVFDTVGFFNENYTNSEDADLWMRIGEVFSGVFLDYTGVVRRSHEEDQLTKNGDESKNQCVIEVVKAALVRNGCDKKNAFRIYKLRGMLLKSSNKNKYIRGRIKLMLSYPVQALKHLYLVLSNFLY